MRTKVPALGALAAGALMVAMAFAPQAQANEVTFGFNGFGISGNALLTVAPNVAPPAVGPGGG